MSTVTRGRACSNALAPENLLIGRATPGPFWPLAAGALALPASDRPPAADGAAQ